MRRMLLLIVAFMLAGCAYRPPSLKVADVHLAERTDSGIVLLVSVEAENRNEVELPLRDVHYTVTLENGWSFSGVRSPEASLRRLGRQRFSFPAVFALAPGETAPQGEVGCTVSGRLGYTTPNQIAQDLFDSGVRKTTVSFRDEKRVKLDAAR